MDLLRRPEVNYVELMSLPEMGPGETDPAVIEQLEIAAKYAGYIERQREEIERNQSYVDVKLAENLDYDAINGLSSEVKQKLQKVKPATIAQAGNIPGVTPAAISLLLVHLKRKRGLKLDDEQKHG
jgi:tRNA uridine 5-carboxymethylaminomethyl modification enzyme